MKVTFPGSFLLIMAIIVPSYIVFFSWGNADRRWENNDRNKTGGLHSNTTFVIARLKKELRELRMDWHTCNCTGLKTENDDLKDKIAISLAKKKLNETVWYVDKKWSELVKLVKESKKLRSFGSTAKIKPVTVPYFCPPEVSDHTKWLEERVNINWTVGNKAWVADPYYASNNSKWFCDKLWNNLEPWVEPTKLTPDDFVIGIYTGESIFYSRSSIVVDTWLHNFKHHYLYAAQGEPSIPVHGLESYNLKPEYIDPFVTSYVQIWGLKDMYLKNPNAKWYYIVGCDTFLNTDYMMRALQGFDPSKGWWITKGNYGGTFTNDMNLTGWKSGSRQFMWFHGGVGWFISNPVMREYANNVDRFMAANDIRKICFCPDKITGMILSLIGYSITTFRESGWDELAVDGKRQDMYRRTKEYIQYHYISPYKMAMAEHRVTHEKLDRIINTGDPNRVIFFFREFVDKHYSVLKRRMRQVKYLARVANANKAIRRLNKTTHNRDVMWNSWGLEEEEIIDDIPDLKFTGFIDFST